MLANPGKIAQTLECLQEFLKDSLSPVEMANLIELRDSVPVSPAGKALRKELKS